MKTATSFMFLLTACISTLHAQPTLCPPQKMLSPGFRESGEYAVAMALMPIADKAATLNLSPSVDLAFAPTNHILIAGAYHSLLNMPEVDLHLSNALDISKLKGYTLEAGMGYFRTLGKKGHAELLALYGNGSLERRGNTLNLSKGGNFTTSYHCLTMQPAIGISNAHKALEAGISYSIRKFYSFRQEAADKDYADHILTGVFSSLGTFINLEAGSELMHFNIQGGAYLPIGRSVLDHACPYLTMGIAFRFAPSRYAAIGNKSFVVSY